MTTGKIFIILLINLSLACGAKQVQNVYPSLPGYELTNPVIVHLRDDLSEISGIFYYNKDSSIFAINDELGILYKIYITNKVTIKTWRFSSEGDYEDIVQQGNLFYTLNSSGSIKIMEFNRSKPEVTDDRKIPLKGHNEFESMYYDAATDKLVLLCKDCHDDSKKIISAYSFNMLDQSFSKKPYYTIDARKIATLLGSDKIKFKPSGAAMHPLTNELYIVSAVNNALVITDREGIVKKAITLNPVLFKQPEGITFSPRGDMFISNESADIGLGNILIFKYKPQVNEKG